jgi:ELWxxDGT repeat protein
MKIFISFLFLYICIGFTAHLNAQTLSLVKDMATSPSVGAAPSNFVNFNGKIYFTANDSSGHKIYSTDGTAAGTQFVGPMGMNSVVYYLVVYNNKLFFTYDDKVNGLELWTCDGSTAGTNLFKDIWPGTNGSVPYSSLPTFLTIANGLLFFQASSPTKAFGLWVSDGTPAGTQMLGSNLYATPAFGSSSFDVFNNKIYFGGNPGSSSLSGLWSSDGTVSGTQLVKSGQFNFGGGRSGMVILNGKMYFAGGDNITGIELWTSDGTGIGTVLLKDIRPTAGGFNSGNPHDFTLMGNQVYFSAEDGVNGEELWVTDGTNAGTQLFKDIEPGAASSNPKDFFIYNSEIYFRTGSIVGTTKLNKTDGTTLGTISLQTFPPNTNAVTNRVELNGKLYFFINSTIGYQQVLYESNGTAAGTFPISPNIQSVLNSNVINDLGQNNSAFIIYNSELYLPAEYKLANGASHGVELCKLVFNPPVGLFSNNTLNNKIKLYPNPVSDYLQIDKAAGGYVIIKDVLGNAIQSFYYAGKKTSINMSELAVGIYYLYYNNTEEHCVTKFVKQ